MKTKYLFLAATFLVTSVAAFAQPSANDIVFTARLPDGNEQIYSIRSDGSGQTALTNDSNASNWGASWSNDDRKIVFVKDDWYWGAVWKMDPDGTNQTLLQWSTFDYGFAYHPVFSPDGSKIAFAENDGYDNYAITVMNADGSNPQYLTTNGRLHEPNWSPDGNNILYQGSRDTTGIWSIYLINSNGTDNVALTTNGHSPDWSPDGTKIVFDSYRDGNYEIYVMNADGSNQTRITNTPYNEFRPNWSPDGTRLAFSSDSDGFNNIYIMNADGTNVVQVTQNVFDCYDVDWRHVSIPSERAPFDFDGDGRSDVSVFRPSDSVWYLNQSSQGFTATQFGISTDKIVPADYDGDGKTDIAVFRDGTWWRMNSSNSTVFAVQFGLAGDLPVPADYTGDGRDEIALFRGGQWWTLDLSNGQSSLVNFGSPGDKPVPADYDGDGRIDQAVYRNGEWHLNRSTGGYVVYQFGIPTDSPVVGDYTGDGKTDVAVWRPSTGLWYVMRSEDLSFFAFPWGANGDIPAPGDYDGDGKHDAAVFRSGTWFINRSTGTPLITAFGAAGDRPISNAFVP